MGKNLNPYMSSDYFMDHLKHIISISKMALRRVPDEELEDPDSCWDEYDIHQVIADSILAQYLENYQPNIIQIRAAINGAKIGYVTFYYKNERIVPHLHYGLVTDDTVMPDILVILNACISQNTANPELYRDDFDLE